MESQVEPQRLSEGSSSPNTSCESFWDQAYNDLRQEDAGLIKDYEKVLAAEYGLTLGGPSTWTREQEMSALVTRKLGDMTKRQWRLKFGKKYVKIRDQVDRVVRVAVVARESVTVATNADPVHAGLAWAPICLLLNLMTNDFGQRNDVINGLEYITNLIRRYSELERNHWQNAENVLQSEFQRSIRNLYRHILEYEAKAILQFDRMEAVQFARNVVVFDPWKGLLNKIHELDDACDRVTRRLDAKDHQMRMCFLETTLNEPNRRVQELLEQSRSQDEEDQSRLLAELSNSRKQQEDWRQDEKNWRLIEQESKCFECLRTTEYDIPRNNIKNPEPGTCGWFWRHPRYRDWHSKSTSAWLWVTAEPGCGKSVLSKHLVNHYESLQQPDQRQNVCYFFFSYDSDANRSVANALCAILHQLFTQNTSLLKYAMPMFKVNGSKLSELFLTLWDIFMKATSDPIAGNTICILDGLDECEESGRSLLVEKLSTIFSTSSTTTRLKMLTTSRPDAKIRHTIRQHGVDDPESFLLMGENKGEMDSIASEIAIFIKSRVAKVRNFRYQDGIYDDADRALEKKLASIQNQNYLWVALIFPELEENASLAQKDLLNLVHNIPTSVDKAYEKMLRRAADPLRARKLLNIVVAAARPLTVTEINIALTVEDGHSTLEDCGLEADSIFEKGVRKLCGDFIRIQDSKVYLIHQTAKDFLLSHRSPSPTSTSEEKRRADVWKHSFNLAESHLVLANSCVSYLLFTDFGHNARGESTDYTVNFKLRKQAADYYSLPIGFLAYAASFWFYHCREAPLEDHAGFSERIAKLCDTRSDNFATWFNLTWAMRSDKPWGYTDLIVASQCGLEPVVKLLLGRKDIRPNAADGSGETSLCLAARWGHNEVVKVLLAASEVDPNARDLKGRTPLWQASCHGHEKVVETLLEQPNVDANIPDRRRSTPLETAIYKEHQGIVGLLLRCKKVLPNPVLANGEMLLQTLVAEGRIDIIKLLLQRDDIDPNFQNEQGTSAIWTAAQNGYKEMVELLLDYSIRHAKRPDIFVRDEHGWTFDALLSTLGDDKLCKSLAELRQPDSDPGFSCEWYPDSVTLPINTDVRVDPDGLSVIAADFWTTSAAAIQVRANHPVPPRASDFYFEVRVVISTCVGIGLCTADSDPYSMPGWYAGSCGYHGHNGRLYHADGLASQNWPPFGSGDVIGCGFDYETKEVSYTRNGKYLGVAFTGLKGVVFPVVGIKDVGTCVQFNFGGSPFVYTREDDDDAEVPQDFDYYSDASHTGLLDDEEGDDGADVPMEVN